MLEIYILMRSFLLWLLSCSALRALKSQRAIPATCSDYFITWHWEHQEHADIRDPKYCLISFLYSDTPDRIVTLFPPFLSFRPESLFLSICQNILSVLSVANNSLNISYSLMTSWFAFAQIVMSLIAFTKCIFDLKSVMNVYCEINGAMSALSNRNDLVWRRRRLDCSREFKRPFKNRKDFVLLRTS